MLDFGTSARTLARPLVIPVSIARVFSLLRGCRMLYRGIEFSIRKSAYSKRWVWSFIPTRDRIVNSLSRHYARTEKAAIQSAHRAIDQWLQKHPRTKLTIADE